MKPLIQFHVNFSSVLNEKYLNHTKYIVLNTVRKISRIVVVVQFAQLSWFPQIFYELFFFFR